MKLNGHSELKTSPSSNMPLQNDSGSRANIGRSSVLQISENNLKASTGRHSVSQISDSAPKETKSTASSGLIPSTPQRAGTGSSTKTVGNSTFASGGTTLKRSSLKSNNASNLQNFSKADVVPMIVPRTSSGAELATDSRSDAADAPAVLSKAGRRLESVADSWKESADAAPAVLVPRTTSRMEMASDSAPVLSKASRRVEPATDSRTESANVAPVIVPRTTSRMEMASDSRRELSAGRVLSPFGVQSRYTEQLKLTNDKVGTDKVDAGSKHETNDFTCQIFLPQRNGVIQTENSEETREDVKRGTVVRLGFSSSAEPNISHCSENWKVGVNYGQRRG